MDTEPNGPSSGDILAGDREDEWLRFDIVGPRRGDSFTKATAVLTQRPIGLEFELRMPLVISRVERGTEAERQGVQIGWELDRVDSDEIDGCAVNDVYNKLQVLASELPLRQATIMNLHFRVWPSVIRYLPMAIRGVQVLARVGKHERIWRVNTTALNIEGLLWRHSTELDAVDPDGPSDGDVLEGEQDGTWFRTDIAGPVGAGTSSVVTVVIQQKPVGISFKLQVPLVISQVDMNSHGAEQGAKIGWELFAINGLDITDMDFDDAYARLHAATALLP